MTTLSFIDTIFMQDILPKTFSVIYICVYVERAGDLNFKVGGMRRKMTYDFNLILTI